MTIVATTGRCVNKAVTPVVKKFGRLPSASGRRGLAVVHYQGHRSGRHFSLVAAFRRTDRGLAITVELPEQKRWWRNFTERRPLVIEVAGEQRTGYALASRDGRGPVHVLVDLVADQNE